MAHPGVFSLFASPGDSSLLPCQLARAGRLKRPSRGPQGVLLSSALAGSLLPSYGSRGQGVKPAICPEEALREGQPHFGLHFGIGALTGGGGCYPCLHSSSASQSEAVLTWEGTYPEDSHLCLRGRGWREAALPGFEAPQLGIGGSPRFFLPDLHSLEGSSGFWVAGRS